MLKLQANYGSFEAYPARFNFHEAWVLINGTWRSFNVAEVNTHAGVMTQDAFEREFGQVPALPAAAFHSGE